MKAYRRFIPIALMWLLVLILVACREEREPPIPSSEPAAETAIPTPTIAPTVTHGPWPSDLEVSLVSTADPVSFSPQSPFVLHFNQPMDKSSVGLPLLITPFVAGSHTWNDTGTHLTYFPDGGFASGETYSIVLDSELRAVSGLGFARPAHWEIQVAVAPRLSKRTPIDLHLSTRHPTIELSFDRPMDRDSVVEALDVYPEIPLTMQWDRDRLVIEPIEAMTPGTLYNFTLSQVATDERGIPVSEIYRWSYRPRSVVASTVAPKVGENRHTVVINFNYEMDTDSVRRALHFKPAIVGDLTWDGGAKVATFTPAAPLPVSTLFTLSFDEPLMDAAGDLLPNPDSFRFTTPPPVLSIAPEGEAIHPATVVQITFDRPVDEGTTTAAFSISPETPGTLSWTETTLTFQPQAGYLDEYSNYTVSIDTSASDSAGQPLFSEPYTWTFRTGELNDIANFGWGPNAQVLDADGRRAVQFQLFQADNDQVTLELYRLSLSQFLDRYASGFRGVAGWENSRPISSQDTLLIKRWDIQMVASPVRYVQVQEAIIPEDVPPGLYLLNLVAGHVNDQLILLISHNTISVKQAEGQLLAWVTNINGGVVAGADVEVYARDGTMIANGRTGDNGVFSASVDRDPQPLIVVARMVGRDGSDVTASGLSNEWRSRSGQWWGWWQPTPATRKFAASIYTDRPIYRPGQSVFFKAIVRQDEDAILDIPPAGTPVTVRIRDSRDNIVHSFELATNHFGTVDGMFQLGDGAMLGEYAVELVWSPPDPLAGELLAGGGESQRQAFKVEAYRKPDFQVIVGTNETRFIEGDSVEVTVDASYFLGEPVPNADVAINLFQLSPREWWASEPPTGGSDYVWHQSYEPVRSGRTDDNGRYTFTLPAETGFQTQWLDWRSNLQQTTWAIEATADDGSHQTVSGFAIINVFNAVEKLRLDTKGYLHQPGQGFQVRIEVQDMFDKPVADRDLDLSLRRWALGSYDYDTVVQSVQLRSDSSGQASTLLTIQEPGFYQLRLSGLDRLGKYIEYTSYVYAFSHRFTNWYGQSESLSIGSDKESYAPGDTARLVIESDVAGPALLTFERGTVRRQELVVLTPPVTLVDVTIQPDDAPNIYVTVNAWQEQDTMLTEESWNSLPDSRLRVASTKLSVPVTDKRLAVQITPDKERYAPGEEATIAVRVTNQDGVPVSAEVSLAVVDEAIFALSEDLSGDIWEAFYYERPNIVRTYDALALMRFWGGGGGGGGGDGIGSPRSEFSDTAAWFPALHTDFNGETSVTFTLPDNLTSWRLTAKATTADTQVGESYTNVLVQQEIVVRPILPRSLTAGDQVNLSAIIHNYSETTQRIEASLILDETRIKMGAGRSEGSQAESITLAPGELRLVGWPVRAAAAGESQILLQAAVDGVIKDAIQLPLLVRALAVPDVSTQVGQFRGELATTFEMPDGALPISGVRLELSRSIAGTLLEGLEYLTGFPYGCVEQTMSRALPNAVVGRALAQLGVTNPTLQAELPGLVSAGLQRLYGYQHNDGGWGWWYDDSSHDYQTAWVIFGLAMMADAGYEVDAGVIDRGVDWLNEHLDEMDARTRAYALYSMAMAGRPNLEEALSLKQQLDGLDTFSRAGLALAFHVAGANDEAESILDYLAETAVVDEGGRVYWTGTTYDGAYYQKSMASATRSTALALSAFARIRPGHELEPGMVRWLMSQRRLQGWGSTNETSYAILGLTDHLLASSYSESAASTGYTVYLNGVALTDGRLGQGEPAVTIEIPARELRSGLNQLRVTQSGGDLLYYVLNRRAYLAQERIEAAGDVLITRAYLDAATGKEIRTARAGQLVKVQLTMTMPESATYVIVEDSLPGGLEPLNEGLLTSSHIATAYGEPSYQWQAYGYNYKEIRDDKVTFFITEMEEGSRVFTYIARATHDGSFVAMPAEAYAMYDLATWGRSASSRLIVRE